MDVMKHLNNNQLVSELKNLCAEERKLTAQVLDYLREVERRKLFLEMGYSSLFDFCVKELGYCESSAHRRISAMRLIKELPHVEEKIVSGELSLSVVSQAQSFFKKQERKNQTLNEETKLNLLTQLENISTRECEKVLQKLDPEPLRKDIEKPISEELTEIRLTVDKEFTAKIERLKNLLSNANPNLNTKELLTIALDTLLQKTDPTLKRRLPKKSVPAEEVSESKLKPQSLPAQKVTKQGNAISNISAMRQNRYIPSTIKQEVWHKSEGQCCYKNPQTSQRCTGRKFLHYDHVIPLSKGGRTIAENIQLLCSNHNLWKSNRIL